MGTLKRWDVLGLGAVAVDDLLFVDEFPRPDGKTPVRARQRAGGGLAGTALVAAARLGTRAAYCGVLGDDDLARFTLAELEREGVDCTPVLHRPGALPFYSVILIVRGGAGRSILFSADGVQPPRPDDLDESLIASARVLFVDHTAAEAGARAAEIAHRRGIPVVADVEAVDFPGQAPFLAAVDHLIVNLEIAQALTGASAAPDCAAALLDGGRAAAVVTAGDQGCWYATPARVLPVHQIALPVPVVDTTGCGDVFHGAYAACLSWGGTIAQAVRLATLAAGLKATHPGGRAGIPTRAEIDAHQNHLPFET